MAAPKGNKNAVGNEGGAPKIGLDILWDNWYNDILELYKEGASDIEIRALIAEKCVDKTRASYKLWERWIEDEIEFRETIKAGRLYSEAWWVAQGRKSLTTKYQGDSFNYTGWYMNMKNRFGWKDRSEVEQNVTSNQLEVVIKRMDK